MTTSLTNWLPLLACLMSWFHVPVQVQWTFPDDTPRGGYFADEFAMVEPATRIEIDVLANDELFGYGDPAEMRHIAQLSVISAPHGGSVQVDGQRLWYTPGDDFRGMDQFEYSVKAPGVLGRGSVIVQVLSPESALEAGLVWRKGEALQLNMRELIPSLRRYAPRIKAVESNAPQLRFKTCGSRLIIEVVDDLPDVRAGAPSEALVNVTLVDSRRVHHSRSIRLVIVEPMAVAPPRAPSAATVAVGKAAVAAKAASLAKAPQLFAGFESAGSLVFEDAISASTTLASGFQRGLTTLMATVAGPFSESHGRAGQAVVDAIVDSYREPQAARRTSSFANSASQDAAQRMAQAGAEVGN